MTEASHHPNEMGLKYYHNIYNVYKTAQYIKFPSLVSILHVSVMLFIIL